MPTRDACCLCNGNLKDIANLSQYPISFTMTKDDNYKFEDMIFSECIDCNTIQLRNLIDLKVLYDKPHNDNSIGNTWIEHFKEFSNMITKQKNKNGTVLEIGSPTDKMLKYIDNYNNWILLDPNAKDYTNSSIYKDKNIKSIKYFFSETTFFDFKIDTIIHSHLLEHLYNPYELLLNMGKILDNDGNIFISVPNLHLYSFNMLFLGLHFEHTYFLNEMNMLYLCNKCNLEIVNKEYYKNHSIFYQLKKCKNQENISINLLKNFNLGYKSQLFKKINEIKKMIMIINSKIKDKKIYIFGCHSNTQAMLYFGLNINNVKYILDNDKGKWDKKLYGYQLQCKSPEIIKNIEEPIVICNVGPYTNEIKKQLREINNKTQIL